MQIELMALQIVLRPWLERPDAPISEINSHWFPPDQRTRLYTHEEILRMRDSLKCHARKLKGACSAIGELLVALRKLAPRH